MFSASHWFEATGESFHPLLQVETTSTSEKPLPAIEFSNALRIAFLQALRQRKVSSSAVAMLSLVSAVKSSSGTGLGRRSGQVSAYWMGMRISGTPSCAMME